MEFSSHMKLICPLRGYIIVHRSNIPHVWDPQERFDGFLSRFWVVEFLLHTSLILWCASDSNIQTAFRSSAKKGANCKWTMQISHKCIIASWKFWFCKKKRKKQKVERIIVLIFKLIYFMIVTTHSRPLYSFRLEKGDAVYLMLFSSFVFCTPLFIFRGKQSQSYSETLQEKSFDILSYTTFIFLEDKTVPLSQVQMV